MRNKYGYRFGRRNGLFYIVSPWLSEVNMDSLSETELADYVSCDACAMHKTIGTLYFWAARQHRRRK